MSSTEATPSSLNLFYVENDAEFQHLRGLGYTGSITDMQKAYLVSLGYTGSVSDMRYAYYSVFNPLSISWDGLWDADMEATLSGSDVVSLDDQTGNSRIATYEGTASNGKIAAINSLDVVDLLGVVNNRIAQNDVAALIPAGTNVAMTVGTVFSIDAFTAQPYGVIWGWDDTGASNEYTMMIVRKDNNKLQMWQRSATSGLVAVDINYTVTLGETTAVVIRLNGDGTFDAVVNGVAVNEDTALSAGVMTAPDILSFGAWPTGTYGINGKLGQMAVKVGAVTDAELTGYASYQLSRYGI